MNQIIEQKIATWLGGNYEEATKQAIRDLQVNQPAELEESFYKNCKASYSFLLIIGLNFGKLFLS